MTASKLSILEMSMDFARSVCKTAKVLPNHTDLTLTFPASIYTKASFSDPWHLKYRFFHDPAENAGIPYALQ